MHGPDGQALPFSTPAEVLEFLREADVVERERLGEGTNRPWRVMLERNGVRARAVFRDVSVRRDHIRLRKGPNYLQFFDRAIHECAAYEMAVLLGLDAVPPVVERTISGSRGTLQIWIENALTDSGRARRGWRPPDTALWRRERQVMHVFDALVANIDRNSGNRIYDPAGNLWMIDHTRAFQRPRGDPDFSMVQQIPAELLDSLRNLNEQEVRRSVGRYLERGQIKSMLARHKKLLEYIDALVAERGAGAVIIP